MFLKALTIEGVRNLRSPELYFDHPLNFLIGANGSGKTSVLEAVSLLCRGQSFRSPNIGTVIRHGENSVSVWGEIQDEARGTLKVAFRKTRANETEARVNGEEIERASKLIEYLPLQVITADAADLVLGAPKARRRFIDWGIVHEHSTYLSWRRDFQRVLRQRNTCLKRVNEGGASDELDVWDRQLIDIGQRISTAQADYVAEVNEALLAVLPSLMDGEKAEQEVTVSYYPGWSEEDDFANVIRSARQRDVKLGRTVTGPHAADIRIQVSNRLASRIVSRGEARALAQALSIAQADKLQRATGRRSLFLVDELAGEMDAGRRGQFLALLASRQYQVLAASAISLEGLGALAAQPGCGMFHVEQGRIKKQQE
ncbi:MAG: DNA replication/repair protein RecF [Gammaproteobacteria bacterium]|nr:DNA replication/repair protein RecF [Gammaproteobacteria bacterium]